MPEFTEQHLLGLEPKDQVYDVLDTEELAIRVFPNGIKTWVFLYKAGDYDRRRTLGIFPEMGVEQARAELPTARKIAGLANDLEKRDEYNPSATRVIRESSVPQAPVWKRGNVVAATAAAVFAFIALLVLIASQHEPMTTTLDTVNPIQDKTSEETIVAANDSPNDVVDAPAVDIGESKLVKLEEISITTLKKFPETYVAPRKTNTVATQQLKQKEPVPKVDRETKEDTSIEQEVAPTVNEMIVRAQFASNVSNREPVDKLTTPQLTWQGSEHRFFHFFTEFYGAQGQTLSHNWYLNGELQTTIAFPVKSPYRWRVYSKKRVTPTSVGEWRVDVVNEVGDVLHSDVLSLVPERTLADGRDQ